MGDIISLIIGVGFCSIILHVILHILGCWEKIRIKIKRPKPKNFSSKVDPIYKLVEGSFGDGYYIEKWELKYIISIPVQFLMLLLPYPIEILYWRYESTNRHYLCEKKDLHKHEGELKELYEAIHTREMEKENERNKVMNERKSKVDHLNRIFTANYSK